MSISFRGLKGRGMFCTHDIQDRISNAYSV